MNTKSSDMLGPLNLGGFGSNSAQTSNSTSSIKPDNAPLPNLKSTNTTKTGQSEQIKSENVIIQPGKEDMATRFEDVYLCVSKEIEKLVKAEKSLSQTFFQNEETGTKTVAQLFSPSTQHKLADIDTLEKLLDNIIKDIRDDQPSVENTVQAVRSVIAETTKFMIKREETQDLLNENGDSTNPVSNNRKLGQEAKVELNLLEQRVDAFSTLINSLEFNLMENIKRSRIQEESLSSYYSFNKKICEIQSEFNSKNKNLVDLEEKVANIRLIDSSRKAHKNSAGFSCVDLSDSEEEETEEKDINDAIQYTTKHIRRFNFFNALYESTNQRAPLSFNKQE